MVQVKKVLLIAALMLALSGCTPETANRVSPDSNPGRASEKPTHKISVEDKENHGKTARRGQYCSVKGARTKSKHGADLICRRNNNGDGPLRWRGL